MLSTCRHRAFLFSRQNSDLKLLEGCLAGFWLPFYETGMFLAISSRVGFRGISLLWRAFEGYSNSRQVAWLVYLRNNSNGFMIMKHCQKTEVLLLLSLLSAVQILTMTVAGRCEASSELLRLRRGLQKTSTITFTRVILDLKGERPTNVASVSPDKLVISFRELHSKLDPENVVRDPSSTIAAIKILNAEKGSQIVVQLRSPDSSVNHSLLPSDSPNSSAYQLLLDVLPPVKQKVPEADGKGPRTSAGSGEKLAEPARGESNAVKQKSGEPSYKEVAEANLPEPLKDASRLLAKGNYEQAFDDYSRYLRKPDLAKDELFIALYGLADSYYFMHQQELTKAAEQITLHYLSAIKAEPLAPQAAWAYYRCGLAYQASGDQEKAIEAFQKAIEGYPKHPAIPLCWLGLGVSYQKMASPAQAIHALRIALELPLDQSQKARAYWLLGSTLYATGEHASAIEALERCLVEDPDWYRQQPLVLKYLGDSYFTQKQYEKSRDSLLRYLNLQPDAPDRDLTLTLVAEVLSAQGEQGYANKFYDYISNFYPDSEGDVIAQIRKAEFLRSKGKLSQEGDLSVFRELARKPLPPELSKLVHLKLASREYEYGNFEESLAVIDHIQQTSSTKTSNNEFLALRSKVILDWSKQAFQNHDFGKVIQLYEGNGSTFQDADIMELDHMIAESYARTKQYKKAIALYEQILAKKGPKVEEDIWARMAECSFQAEDYEATSRFCSQLHGAQFRQKKMELLAQIYFTQRRYSKVIECLGSLPEKDIAATTIPNLSAIYGESLFQAGECEKAIPWLQKATEQLAGTGGGAEELIRFHMAQAACYSKLKKYDKAIALLEDATSMASTDSVRDQLNYDISKIFLELGETDKAVQTLTKLMDSTQSFWKTAAKQQLDYIQMQHK
jgi:tetratricopeptide (TPR) repeat protein